MKKIIKRGIWGCITVGLIAAAVMTYASLPGDYGIPANGGEINHLREITHITISADITGIVPELKQWGINEDEFKENIVNVCRDSLKNNSSLNDVPITVSEDREMAFKSHPMGLYMAFSFPMEEKHKERLFAYELSRVDFSFFYRGFSDAVRKDVEDVIGSNIAPLSDGVWSMELRPFGTGVPLEKATNRQSFARNILDLVNAYCEALPKDMNVDFETAKKFEELYINSQKIVRDKSD